MGDNINSNPFAGLFTSVNDAATFSTQSEAVVNNSNENVNTEEQSMEQVQAENLNSEIVDDSEESESDERLNELIADVFGITLQHEKRKKPTRQLVFIDSDSIEHAIFERLLLAEPESKLISKENTKGQDLDSHVVQTELVPYLFESYCRLQRYRVSDGSYDTVENIQKIIMRDISTALQEPDLFIEQEVHDQLILLFMDGGIVGAELSSFIAGIVENLCLENKGSEEEVIKIAFSPILNVLHAEAARSTLLMYKQYWFCILTTFASLEPLGKLIIKHSTVKSGGLGKTYADTLLGSILSLSCLPKSPDGPAEFYDKPFLKNSIVERNVFSAIDAISESMHKVFHSLFKCSGEVRHLTLQWLGDCLHSNAGRGKLWNSHNNLGFADVTTVSDGFMLNLGNVLLRLCQPFCSKPNDIKILKIDPTYCAAEAKNDDERQDRGMHTHMTGMSNVTCLIPTPEGETRLIATSYNFVTEIFFITHRALDLGYRLVLEKLFKLSQDLARIQRLYNDARLGNHFAVNEFLTQQLESEMSRYLAVRASLIVPELLNLLAKFHSATAFWLMQVNVHVISEANKDSYAPNECKPITFPLADTIPETLRCIPEFVVENTVSFICFLRRWCPNVFEEQGPSFLHPVLTEVVALMESPSRLYNPHLRASLAEGLEALLPNNEDTNNQSVQTLGTFHRQQLFVEHPHRQMIVPNLLHVFVSIEMTGQSVQFEQKFNYRRPMYVVMAYLWKLPEHRNIFKQLAQEAENNMEAVQPPLFLRFVNLLMNDAVFLLDDALTNIAQLRQMINARDSGEWDKLPQQEREQQTYYLEHIGMIARFDNILGRETIQTLKLLTTEIKSIFCHPTMVDRIAAMLNYLLLQLVGPNKKNLKVKDQKEYDFNPANLVLNICEIYINLSNNDNFTLAVSQDGRSYSPELFQLAVDVLVRIGGVGILSKLDEFAKKVELVATQKKKEEEILNDAPDDFLDPIMSTLMTDPVILPSSKTVVDRQTIARHLLSDQTDPFNRSPLTMDMVKSDVDLKSRILEWIDQKKREKEVSTSDSQ